MEIRKAGLRDEPLKMIAFIEKDTGVFFMERTTRQPT